MCKVSVILVDFDIHSIFLQETFSVEEYFYM